MADEHLSHGNGHHLAEYKAMCRAINGKKTALIIGGLSLFLIVAGAGTWITNNRGLGIFFMVLGVIYPLLFHLVSNRAIRKVYRTTKISQNLPLDYTFEPERLIVKSTNGESQIRYEDLYKVIETPTHFYLMIGGRQAYIVVKANCEPALIAFLKALREQIGRKNQSAGHSKAR
ncbi:YcxB family protein [Pseudoramibacter alactolyticus]|uniref:YcxB family protein n=1 Tax=Pseudoramibacter alactolyticus TaxID=113287 RepID=UPI0028EDE58E|nr:YcxB family protein [Pseudoramibacter alactolyticus]